MEVNQSLLNQKMPAIAERNENEDSSDTLEVVDKENEVIVLDDDDDDDGVIDLTGFDDYVSVTKNDVAQAFSHFSYVYSGKKMLICDLQGVYDMKMKLFRVSFFEITTIIQFSKSMNIVTYISMSSHAVD